MEILNSEIERLLLELDKIDPSIRKYLNDAKYSYPFNKIGNTLNILLQYNILTYNQYCELQNNYTNRNQFLYLFELGPRNFGDNWAFSHLLSIVPELKQQNKKNDPKYDGEYDLYLPYEMGNIKIEVKASRVVDKDRPNDPLYNKALSSNSKKRFEMNFQQLKPDCCDVFVWIAVYTNCIKYWVLKNEDIKNHEGFSAQHRNNRQNQKTYEGQIFIKNHSISSFNDYLVESDDLRQSIIKEFIKKNDYI
jgi:hypothetical protein